MTGSRLRVCFAVGDAAPALAEFAAALPPHCGDRVLVRAVPAGELVGRDLRECDRFVCAGAVTFAALPHLRELCAQRRAATIAVLAGPRAATAADDADELAALRRNCGRVAVAGGASAVTALRLRLLVPVHRLAAGDAGALWVLLAAAPGAGDAVATRLVEAQQHLRRGDAHAAFGAAARALQQAPDQPGVVADVARLLAGLGERERAVTLCRTFLRQGTAAAPVVAALRELAAG